MKRPLTSQIVIDEFTKIIDSQDAKGFEKYGKSIDAANGYNWEHMALEETADLQKYLVRRIGQLSSELMSANSEIGKLEREIQGHINSAEEMEGMLRQANEQGKNMINIFCKEAFLIAKSKGWHDEPRETGTLLALIHSEVSEALEADRKGDHENFVEELADVCIRIFDFCGSRDIDLETAISKKMQYNRTRTYKHGGKAY